MGEIVTNPPSTPNTVSDSWQTLLDVNTMSYYGLNRVTLTNWDSSSTIPKVAQGSAIDIDGSVARFTADEAIGGSPADGVVYLKFAVSGAVVTPELTATAPTWYADKAGWYNVAGERYSGHKMHKSGTTYTYKRMLLDSVDGEYIGVGPFGRYYETLIVPGNTVMAWGLQSETVVIAGGGYAPLYKYTCRLAGEYRISWLFYKSSGGTAYTKIYKNGVAYGPVHSTTSGSYVTASDDLVFNVGDTIEVWYNGSSIPTHMGIKDIKLKNGNAFTDFENDQYGYILNDSV